MLDLSNKESHKFWRNYPDPIIYRTVSFMEGVEKWTADGNQELEEALVKLEKIIDEPGNIDIQEEDRIIDLLANLKMGRSLRILHALDTASPSAASKLLEYAEHTTKTPSNSSEIFLRRNTVFERLRLLAKIFSEERFNDVTKAMEQQ